MNPSVPTYADYASFSTIVVTADFDALTHKAVNDMLLSWGYDLDDLEDCVQETFTFYDMD